MADETISNKSSLPPKVNLQNTDALKAGSAKGAPLAAKPVTLKDKPISKSETAKIPLDMAAAGITIVDNAPETKTIKIKPVSAPGTVKVSAATANLTSTVTANVAKSQTSKIPLDTILPTGSVSPAGGPKTIRLKRPSATSKPSVVPAPATVAKIAKDTKADLTKTSRLDIGDAGVESSATPTSRKTIRVKRPTSGAVPSLNISRSNEPAAAAGGALPTAGAPLPPMQVEMVEEKCIISGIASILALFVICTLVYVLLAQVSGSNGSLSKLSYFMPEVNLAWPGKIPAN